MKQRKIAVSIAAVAMLSLAACGSSGSSTSTSSTSADATKSVDAVSVDATNLDASQSSASANISATTKVSKGFGSSAGDTSRAGCELNQIKGEAIRLGKQTDAILCYLGTTQDNNASFVIDSTQRFYSITAPVGESGSKENMTFVLRVQKSDGTLTMDMCEDGALSEELTVTQNGTSVTASGYHYFKGNSGGAGAGFEDKGGFDLTLALKSDASGEIGYSDIDSGSLTANFVGTYGQGRMTLSKTAALDLNDVTGIFVASFGTGDGFTGQLAGRTDATKGAVKYAVTGTFPAIPKSVLPSNLQSIAPNGICPMSSGFDSCDPSTNFSQPSCQTNPTLSCMCMQEPTNGQCTFTDSGTESFSITTNSSTGNQTFTITAANDYQTTVDAMTLPVAADIVTPAATRGWDCSTTGKTVTSIDVTTLDFSACDAKAGKGFDDSSRDSCHEQESTGKVDESEFD